MNGWRLSRLFGPQRIRLCSEQGQAFPMQHYSRRGGQYYPVLLAEVEGKISISTTALLSGRQTAATHLFLPTGKRIPTIRFAFNVRGQAKMTVSPKMTIMYRWLCMPSNDFSRRSFKNEEIFVSKQGFQMKSIIFKNNTWSAKLRKVLQLLCSWTWALATKTRTVVFMWISGAYSYQVATNYRGLVSQTKSTYFLHFCSLVFVYFCCLRVTSLLITLKKYKD